MRFASLIWFVALAFGCGGAAAVEKAKTAKSGPAAVAAAATAVAAPATDPAVAATAATEPAPAAAPAPGAPKPIPSPKLLAAEIEHVARYDAAIAPVREMVLSAEDLTHVRDAFKAIAAGKFADAQTLRGQIADPTAKKLVEWGWLRTGFGTARDIRKFQSQNPIWPDRGLLTQRAEEALFTGGGSSRDIAAFFEGGAPKTGIGHAALASAKLAEGDAAGARDLAAKAWRTLDIPTSLETGFLDRFKALLTEADHKWRLDRLLAHDSRWATERADRAGRIRRLIPQLSEPERRKAEARLAVYLRSASADKLIAALPADAATVPRADWGLALQLAQWHRRGGRLADARAIWLTASVDAAEVAGLDEWWEERRGAAYDTLRRGDAAAAYALVKSPGALTANARKDASFLAGWLALSYLGDKAKAEAHFADLVAAADGPLSRAKAHYWYGRVLEARGDQAKAEANYKLAGQGFDTFYGLVARLRIAPKAPLLTVTPPAAPTPEQITRFNALDAIRSIVISKKAGLDLAIQRALIGGLRDQFESEAETAMLAHVTEAMGDTQMALRIGKAAVARGLNLVFYAYPIHPMPAYTPLRVPPEPAFVLAIARQESEFNTSTFSGVGARGILQVMPVTAQHVCRDYRVKCDIPRLMTDASYNTMLGAAYIADRMSEFQGSYVVTMAGYNAGPGRARQWMRENGDPRDGKTDPLDWIHAIPFEETREYVQKVMANVQVYRARLGEDTSAVRLSLDLKRPANFVGQSPRLRARPVIDDSPATPADAAPEPKAGDLPGPAPFELPTTNN